MYKVQYYLISTIQITFLILFNYTNQRASNNNVFNCICSLQTFYEFMQFWHKLEQEALHSRLFSGQSECNRHCPNNSTTNFWPANSLCHSSCHILQPVQRDPVCLRYFLKFQFFIRFLSISVKYQRQFPYKIFITAMIIIVDTIRVKSKRFLWCINGNWNWSMLENRNFQCIHVSWSHVYVSRNFSGQSNVPNMTISVLKYTIVLQTIKLLFYSSNNSFLWINWKWFTCPR